MSSIFVNKALQLDDEVEGMLFWEKDNPFPKSLGHEVLRWRTLWQPTDRELPNNLLLALGACDEDAFPNIVFTDEKNQDLLQFNNVLFSPPCRCFEA